MQDTSKYKTSPKPLLWKDETTNEMKPLLTVVILEGYVKEDSVCLLKYQAHIWNTSF